MSEPTALKEFASWAFDAAFEGCDLDGEEIQDKGVTLGLLEERKVNPENNVWGAEFLYFKTSWWHDEAPND